MIPITHYLNQPRAILIQDISEFLYQLDRALFDLDIPQENEIKKWIIQTLLAEVYNLQMVGHYHNQYPQRTVYEQVRTYYSGLLERMFSQHVKTVEAYGDTQIEVWLDRRDLYMRYYETLTRQKRT